MLSQKSPKSNCIIMYNVPFSRRFVLYIGSLYIMTKLVMEWKMIKASIDIKMNVILLKLLIHHQHKDMHHSFMQEL